MSPDNPNADLERAIFQVLRNRKIPESEAGTRTNYELHGIRSEDPSHLTGAEKSTASSES